jgi:hypothetical protein
MLTRLRSRSLPSLVAAVALSAAACADVGPDADASDEAVMSENGWTFNGWTFNGWTFNGWTFNGWTFNGWTFNGFGAYGLSSQDGVSFSGLATSGGLSSTSGLMTTAGGREAVKYMVKCAFPIGHNLVKQDQLGTTYTFEGAIGVAPELETGICDLACQEKISGCMLAHVNNSGLHVGIWLVGPDAGIGWGTDPAYPYQEAAYFGNLFASTMTGNYCAGRDAGAGSVKGRLGAPFGTSNNILTSPYGWSWDGVNSQNIPVYCANGGNNYCTPQDAGFSSCTDGSPKSPYTTGHAWSHAVTVYRNFEPAQLYKICNKGGKCLGVVGGSTLSGANIEQRTYTGAMGQTWQVQQVSSGNYKIINRTSGMSLDLNGAQVVQRPYTGAPSQIVPMAYIPSQFGRANLKMSSITNGAQLMPQVNSSYNDGALIQAVIGYPTGLGSPDPAQWSFTPLSSATFDPGRTIRLIPQHATNKSVDVCNGSTTNGNCVRIYDTWNGDPQKFLISDAGNSNMKLTMKLNPNKCVGPRANGTTPGTILEVQDCNGSFNQAWVTGEIASRPGVFIFKNAAAPNLCMDVAGASTANNATMILYTCTGGVSQQFAMQAAL